VRVREVVNHVAKNDGSHASVLGETESEKNLFGGCRG
jgi:hypothetical protein